MSYGESSKIYISLGGDTGMKYQLIRYFAIRLGLLPVSSGTNPNGIIRWFHQNKSKLNHFLGEYSVFDWVTSTPASVRWMLSNSIDKLLFAEDRYTLAREGRCICHFESNLFFYNLVDTKRFELLHTEMSRTDRKEFIDEFNTKISELASFFLSSLERPAVYFFKATKVFHDSEYLKMLEILFQKVHLESQIVLITPFETHMKLCKRPLSKRIMLATSPERIIHSWGNNDYFDRIITAKHKPDSIAEKRYR